MSFVSPSPTSWDPKLVAIAEAMAALPYAGRILVFGSAARGGRRPNDLDVVVDRRGSFYSDNALLDYRRLLMLANKYYGWLDPFVRFDDALIVRNAEATAWTFASNSRAIIKAIDAEAVPLSGIARLIASASQPCSAPTPIRTGDDERGPTDAFRP